MADVRPGMDQSEEETTIWRRRMERAGVGLGLDLSKTTSVGEVAHMQRAREATQ
jgi:hypothetical protein